MINPYKNTESINNFYISLEGKVPLTSSVNNKQTKYCQPDMDWIFNKCMMRSKEYREWRESQTTTDFSINPLVAKFPAWRDYVKARIRNDSEMIINSDYAIETPAFNTCALAYQEFCHKFQERQIIDENLRLN
jgi:hypothetical protein